MPKLTICMTYYQREKQLLKTLDSFRQYNYDFNVVIVDDNSPDDIKLPKDLTFDVTILKLREKKWINPSATFNVGFNYALKDNPDIIIIQNAECYHVGDIIGYALKNVTASNYITFAAYSLGEGQDVDFRGFVNAIPQFTGDSAWYNHSVYRPLAYHFCSVITSANLRRINGFEEAFAQGAAYEDDYFIHQIRTVGLKVRIIDNPFVLHQWHYNVSAFHFTDKLVNGTLMLYERLKKKNKFRAEHFVTPDL